MPFTRPNASQIATASFEVSDPLLEINKDATGANTNDLGIIINRGASGDNVGIIWDRSEQSFALVSTTADGDSTGDITLSAYADLQVKDVTASTYSTGNYTLPGSDGVSGQALTTDGAGNVTWQDVVGGNVSGVLTDSYTSTAQSIVSGGLLQLAHGLGTMPTLVQLRLKCVTAQANYAVNDEVIVNPLQSFTDSKGCSVVTDTTNINIRFGSDTSVYALPDKSTGTITSLTNGNWNILVKAWS